MPALFLICDCAIAACLTWLLNRVALLPFRRAKDAHWTERARVLWPARIAARATLWLLPADLVLAQRLLWYEVAPPWPLAALAAWLGAMVATYCFDHEVFPWLRIRTWAHNVIATWIIRFTVWSLFVGMAVSMPTEINWRAWAIACVFPLAFTLWAGGGLIWCCRMLGLLSPAPPRLEAIATGVSKQMQVGFRRVWLLRSMAAANAFALPFTRDLLFAERLLELHPDAELAAICAHELGHLGESRFMRASRLIGLLFYLPLLFLKPAAWTWGSPGVLVLGLGSWTAYFFSRRIAIRLEKRADRIAQSNESDEGVYARALARLHEANLVPAVLPRQRSHPDLYDRLVTAGVQPDFARPEKPSAYSLRVFVLSALLGVLGVANLERTSERSRNDSGQPTASGSPARPAMPVVTAWFA